MKFFKFIWRKLDDNVLLVLFLVSSISSIYTTFNYRNMGIDFSDTKILIYQAISVAMFIFFFSKIVSKIIKKEP